MMSFHTKEFDFDVTVHKLRDGIWNTVSESLLNFEMKEALDEVHDQIKSKNLDECDDWAVTLTFMHEEQIIYGLVKEQAEVHNVAALRAVG